MERKTFVSIAVLYFFVTAFSWSTWGGYPARYFVQLKDVLGGGAYGKAELDRMALMPGSMSLGINFYRLKPHTVYSVWYTNEKGERAPAGVDRSSFTTDGGGKGRYVTSVYADYLDDWRYIEVFEHPDGDPANTKDMTAALKGDLVYGRSS